MGTVTEGKEEEDEEKKRNIRKCVGNGGEGRKRREDERWRELNYEWLILEKKEKKAL